MAISAGLEFDLSGWRAGVRSAHRIVRDNLGGPGVLGKFDAAVKRSASRMGSMLSGALRAGAVGAVALALVGVAKAFAGITRGVRESLQMFRAYNDSVTTLQSALRAVGSTNISGATRQVQQLGTQLRLAMGMTGTETNATFAGFLTRGFDERQAQQLTVLAANFARKTGKPIAEVSKTIADAANGSADAIKGLGVEVATTGNRAKDGEAAVLALKAAYGEIGTELANPSDRLAAAFNEIGVTLGSRIAPVLEPLIQGFADFVTGLTQTEDGARALDWVARALGTGVEFVKLMSVEFSNLVEMIKAGAGVIRDVLRIMFAAAMRDFFAVLESLPGGKLVMEKLGLGDGMSAAFKEQAQEAGDALRASSSDFMRAQGEFLRKESDTGGIGFVKDIAAQGAAIREQAIADINAQSAATRGEGFAGRPAVEREEQRAEAQRQAAVKRGEQEQARRVKAYGDVRQGQSSITVNIHSKRPDAFRKA